VEESEFSRSNKITEVYKNTNGLRKVLNLSAVLDYYNLPRNKRYIAKLRNYIMWARIR